jgi:uncharacterized membrane protein
MGALEAFTWEWGSVLIRWLHVTAAIAWIGGSFFFMHLDASLRPAIGMRAVLTHAMPPNNFSQMTNEERGALARWLKLEVAQK